LIRSAIVIKVSLAKQHAVEIGVIDVLTDESSVTMLLNDVLYPWM
jgi:hypothetical protein